LTDKRTNIHFYRFDRHTERRGGTAVAVRKGILLVSAESTGVFISTGNQEILPAAVYKSPGRT
jgi:hypothetical protein